MTLATPHGGQPSDPAAPQPTPQTAPAPHTQPGSHPKGRPNIVFIMSDDHAAHSISAYGSRVNSTPHMDRLAREGVRMDAVYCTNSVCAPSRASILTGTYSHVNGVSSIYTDIDYRVPTFPQVLQRHGYRTAIFGKWHLGSSAEALPRGFDEWKIFPGQGTYFDPVMISPRGRESLEGYATDVVTDLSLEWLDTLGEEEPFCLMVHHKAPHRPWEPHERHRHLYADGTLPDPETFFDDHATRSKALKRLRMSVADDLHAEVDLKQSVPEHLCGPEKREERAKWAYQIYMRDYLQCVQAIDDNVGRLIDYLDTRGLGENTMIVYTSDQGFFLGDHGWFDKRLMFDQSLQMPMLIRWPAQIEAGSRCGAIATNVDFAATFLDAAGIDPAALPASQGRSFLPLLRGESVDDWPDAMYYRYWEHDDPYHSAPAHYGIRAHRYTLIHYYGAGLGVPGASSREFDAESELYDLETDPEELTNVYSDPAYATVRADLEARLERLQRELGDEPYRGPDTPHPTWAPHDPGEVRGAFAWAREHHGVDVHPAGE